MNQIQQDQLCSFIKQQFDNYLNVSVISEPFNIKGLMLYINPEKTNYILMQSKSDIVNLGFYDIDYEDPYAFFTMSLEKLKPTLNYIYDLWQSNEQEIFFSKHDKNIMEMKEEITYIKNYLQSYDSSNPPTRSSTIYITGHHDGTHQLEIGELTNSGGRKTKIDSMGIIEIPIKLGFEKYQFIKASISIPCWEVDKYPYLKNFLDIPKQVSTLDDLLPLLKDSAPEAAKDLFYYMLDGKIETKQDKISKKKI